MLPSLSMWIIEGGRAQQSARLISALSSMSLRSFGRSYTQTLSSLSTANPVTPPLFHLFGKGFGQSESNLNLGALVGEFGCCAPSITHQTNNPRPAPAANTQLPLPQFLFM